MPELSPATSAILDAYWETFNAPLEGAVHRPLAAALRAAADQVVPLGYEDVWTDGRILQYEKHDPIREKLLAIAAELEAHWSPSLI